MKQETVHVSVPHRLGKAEARRRLEAGFAKASDTARGLPAGVAVTLEPGDGGDRLPFRVSALGQSLGGDVIVFDDRVDVSVRLPALLAKLADKLRPALERRTKETLALPAK